MSKLIIESKSFLFYEASDETLEAFQKLMEKRDIEPNIGSIPPKKNVIFIGKDFQRFHFGR